MTNHFRKFFQNILHASKKFYYKNLNSLYSEEDVYAVGQSGHASLVLSVRVVFLEIRFLFVASPNETASVSCSK